MKKDMIIQISLTFLKLNLYCLMKSICMMSAFICITEKINYLKKQLKYPNITFFGVGGNFYSLIWEKAILHLKIFFIGI